MIDYQKKIAERAEFSQSRLNEVRDRIAGLPGLSELPRLCIYVTGSFGRMEATRYSDLDVFFIHDGSSESDTIPRIRKTLLDADLIRAAQDLEFPEFSNDGQYLEVHYIDDILQNLGGPKDDFHNHFTARLLLLLESRPLYNDSLYECFMMKIINSYFRDYVRHEETFSPVFLVNDIIRFWRTICLNYEHRRNLPDNDEAKTNKNHLANLKLKFSRLVTCYATIALISINRGISPDELCTAFSLSPFDRLRQIAEQVPATEARILAIRRAYSWFLDKTDQDKSALLEWIGVQDNRQDAFERGRAFGGEVYKLLMEAITDSDAMRFLVV